MPVDAHVIVIDDASPEPEVSSWCQQLAARDKVTVLQNPENLGFVATVNRGMEASGDTDVVLLNSDTQVANDWLQRLQACAYSDDHIGTVTPLSNNASVCSYPLPLRENNLPEGWSTGALDALAARVNGGRLIELPTAVGFCMYIRRACLNAVGSFDEQNFGIGYGEECDFSMRAKAAGWVNALGADVFVYHEGGQSFEGQTEARIRAAEETLHRLHPQYHILATAFIDEDPVRVFRDALDAGRIEQRPGDAADILESVRNHRNALLEFKTNRELGLEHAFSEVKAQSESLRAQLEEAVSARVSAEQKLGDAQPLLEAFARLQQRDRRWRYLLYLINRMDALYLRVAGPRTVQ
jgi:glycosyltransferase involved in cell wall biosynthesis